jgi:hypothetical protein
MFLGANGRLILFRLLTRKRELLAKRKLRLDEKRSVEVT